MPSKGIIVQYANNEALISPSFYKLKIPVLLVITNIILGQLLFHILSFGLLQIPKIEQYLALGNILKFATDMWLIIIIISLAFWGYSKLKKTNHLLLIISFVPPLIIVLLSAFRDVSFLTVAILIFTISSLLLKFCFEQQSEKYLINKANEFEGNNKQ